MDSLPAVRAIRSALKQIPGAIQDEPLSEDIAHGADPGLPVLRLDPSGHGTEAIFLDRGSMADEATEDFDAPLVVFEVPPSLTDGDVRNVLGDGPGDLNRLAQVKGVDAYGWYVTFHQRAWQYGIYIPVERFFAFALQVFAGVAAPLERKLEISFHAILRHELFHFAADCMAANWELSTGKSVYWWAKAEGDHTELEEALANAYMLRGFRYPNGILKSGRGCYHALKAFCALQPAGYRDGPRYARSRLTYVNGCKHLSAVFQHASAIYEGDDWEASVEVLDTSIFYPSITSIDWRRCPILVHDNLGILDALGINLFETINGIIESKSFLKSLSKLGDQVEAMWWRRKADLERSVALSGLRFQPWRAGGPNCYSIRVNSNYRAHLRQDIAGRLWIAEAIGDHKMMGHG